HHRAAEAAELVVVEQRPCGDLRSDAGHVTEGQGQCGHLRLVQRVLLFLRTARAALINTSGSPKPPAFVATGSRSAHPPTTEPTATPCPTSAWPVSSRMPVPSRRSSSARAPSPPVTTIPAGQ